MTGVREIPDRCAFRAFGTPSAASPLISALSSKVITLQSLTVITRHRRRCPVLERNDKVTESAFDWTHCTQATNVTTFISCSVRDAQNSAPQMLIIQREGSGSQTVHLTRGRYHRFPDGG